MKAEVRHFLSPDVDLSSFQPDDPENFTFLLQVIVGPHGSEGDESLQFIVCTPRSLENRFESEEIITGHSLLIADTPDIATILTFVRRLIERIEAETWAGVASRLARIGLYEFADLE